MLFDLYLYFENNWLLFNRGHHFLGDHCLKQKASFALTQIRAVCVLNLDTALEKKEGS